MLANLLAHNRSISLAGCLTQMYFFFALGVTDSCLLAAMAYDRLRGHPAPPPLCHKDVPGCVHSPWWGRLAWLVSHVHSLLHILLMARLSFCASHQVPHFFCDHCTSLKALLL